MLCMKDVKALKRRVEVSFPDLIADDLDALFPAKVNTLSCRGHHALPDAPRAVVGRDTRIM